MSILLLFLSAITYAISQSVGVAFDIVASDDRIERVFNIEFILAASIRLEFRCLQYSCK